MVNIPPTSKLTISMTQGREMTLHVWSEPSALPGSMDREEKPDSSVPGLPPPPAAGCMHWQEMCSLLKSILQVLGATREYQVPS